MSKVMHQIVTGARMGDAVTNHALFIQSLLLSKGYKSEIYGEHVHPNIEKKVKHFSTYKEDRNVSVIHHFSIGSDINDFVKDLNVKEKIMIYHNITPSEYFKGYQPYVAKMCLIGRHQLAENFQTYDKAICDSKYNAMELQELNYLNISVIPIPLNTDEYITKPNKSLLKKLKKSTETQISFIGRIASNKNHPDLIKIFDYYHKNINSSSRLNIVGSYDMNDPYYHKMLKYLEELELNDVAHITGYVEFEDILAYYQGSDIFLSASLHEGFCVPVVEAMFFELPILAYAKAAVPDTMGSGGILFEEMDYPKIGLMLDEIAYNDNLRNKIIENQRQEIKRFDIEAVNEMIADVLELE